MNLIEAIFAISKSTKTLYNTSLFFYNIQIYSVEVDSIGFIFSGPMALADKSLKYIVLKALTQASLMALLFWLTFILYSRTPEIAIYFKQIGFNKIVNYSYILLIIFT